MKMQSPSGDRERAGIRISNPSSWLSLLCMVIYTKKGPTIQAGATRPPPQSLRIASSRWRMLLGLFIGLSPP